MRAAHKELRCRAAGGALACVLGLVSIARADAARVVLLLDPRDPDLAARVEGQSGDLPVKLRVMAAPAAAQPTPAALRALMAEHTADALVWMHATDAGDYTLVVLDASTGETRTRQVQVALGGDVLAASARREALAIVVRAELKALVDREHEASAAARRDASTPQASVASESRPRASRAAASLVSRSSNDTSTQSALRPLRLLGGWDLTWAGPGHVAHAFMLQAGVRLGAFELAIHAAFGWPRTLGDTALSADVARHALTAAVFAQLPLSAATRLLVGVQAGVLLFARTTEVHDPTLTKTPNQNSVSAAIGPNLSLRWLAFGQAGFELGLSLSAVTAAPRYVVERSSGGTLRAHDTWLEPTSTLAFIWAP
jgi:hypothetical protein